MGNLGGHVVPGIFFIIYGLWWIIATLWLYLTQKYQVKQQKRFFDAENISKRSYIPLCLLPQWPVEPVLKIFFASLGVFVEEFLTMVPNDDGIGEHVGFKVWSLHNEIDGSFAPQAKLHHITMYSCFMVSGIVDLLSLCIQYPKHTSKLFLTLAFFVEAFVFYYHTKGDHDRSQLEVLMHELLVISIGVCVLFAGLRMVQSSSILINGGLALGITLQGTWFIEVGIVIFGPTKWEDAHNNSMFIVACFMWHFMCIGVGMLILLTVMQWGVQCNTKKETYQLLEEDLNN